MAARNLGSLTIDLIAKTGGFERGMDRASRTANDRMRRMERRAQAFGKAMRAAFLVGTAALGAASIAIARTVSSMDELTKAADRVQLPVEQFSRLVYAGSLADVSMQDLQSSMGRLTRSMSAALDPASRQAGIFEAIGISVRDAEGNLRSATDVFHEFADAFALNRDSPELMSAGLEVFGRSFQNLIPLIKDGSQSIRAMGDEGERLGIVFDEEAGRKAEQFNDNLTRLRTAVNGVWTQVSVALLPSMEILSDTFVDVAQDGDRVRRTATALTGALTDLVGLAIRAHDALSSLRDTMNRFSPENDFSQGHWLRDRLPDWLTDPIIDLRELESVDLEVPVNVAFALEDPEPSGLFATSTAELRYKDQVEDMRARLARFFTDPTTGRASAASGNDSARQIQEMLREQQRLADAQRGWTDQLLDAQAALDGPIAEANRQHEKQMSDLTRAYYEGEVKLSDYVQMQEVYREQLDRTLEAIEAQRTPAQRLLEDLEFEKDLLRMTNEEREIAIAMRWLNADATDAERDAIAGSVRELRRSREAMSDLIAAQDSVRDAGADFLTDWTTGAKSFKDAMLDALNSIHQRITQMIAENLMDQLFGQRGQDGGGAAGNWLSGIFGALFGGGRANGGWAGANRIFEVNERGLEMATVGGRDYMLTGNQPVQITPNHRIGFGGGGVTNNFAFASPVSPKTQTQMAARVGYEVRRSQRFGT